MGWQRMMKDISLQKDTHIEDVLKRWPETVSFFLAMETDCVGCSMAAFCTVADVAESYEQDVDHFFAALKEFIQQLGKK